MLFPRTILLNFLRGHIMISDALRVPGLQIFFQVYKFLIFVVTADIIITEQRIRINSVKSDF